jgi:hypothetical protein
MCYICINSPTDRFYVAKNSSRNQFRPIFASKATILGSSNRKLNISNKKNNIPVAPRAAELNVGSDNSDSNRRRKRKSLATRNKKHRIIRQRTNPNLGKSIVANQLPTRIENSVPSSSRKRLKLGVYSQTSRRHST